MKKNHIFCLVSVILLLFFICSCKDVELATVKESETGLVEETADNKGKTEEKTEELSKKTSQDIKEDAADKFEEEGEVCVYICGAVVNEGVYSLKKDSRIKDLLLMAGGYSDDAAKGYVNLAEKLVDGEKVYIPYLSEVESTSPKDYKYEDEVSSSSKDKTADDSGLVNLNTASKAELMTLPGIGEVRAEEIIRYREEHGKFEDVEDLMNVEGIKTGVFEKIKDLVII